MTNREAILRSAELTKIDIQEREALTITPAFEDRKAYGHATGHVLEFIASRSNSSYKNQPTTESVIWQGLRERLDKGSSKEMAQNKETKQRIGSFELRIILKTLVQKHYITQSLGGKTLPSHVLIPFSDERRKEVAYYYNRNYIVDRYIVLK